MRRDKRIDYSADHITDDEVIIRLLCSPLYYDETTGQVNIDAFDLRMMGRLQDQPEHFASIGRENKFQDDDEKQRYLQFGYAVWDDKEWNHNRYYGYGTLLASQARAVSRKIELWPLVGSPAYHAGIFYADSDDDYFKGPLPKNDPEILEMLSGLAALIEDNIHVAPSRDKK